MHAGVGRHEPSTMLAYGLAEDLGVLEEFGQSQRAALNYTRADAQGILGERTAMATLRIELARRGWG